MQTMNTDQSPYYQNPAAYYAQPGVEQQYTARNSHPYNQNPRMAGPFYNGQVPNPYQTAGPIFVPGPFTHGGPYTSQNVPRGMNPQYGPLIRPGNEMNNGVQTYIPQQGYAAYSPAPPFYTQHPNYATQNTYSSVVPMTNAPSAYPNSQLQTQSSQTSQSSVDSQQATFVSKPPEPTKRERKPLAIVDPSSHKKVELPTVAPSTNTSSANSTKSTTDSTNPSVTSAKTEETRAAFRSQVAQLLNSGSPNDKTPSDVPIEEPSSKENPIQEVQEPSPSLDIPTEPATDEKLDEDENQMEPTLSDSEPMVNEILPSELLEDISSSKQIDSDNASNPKRYGYTIEELRRKRLSLLSQERPDHLKEIAGVTSPALPKQQPKKMEVDGDKQYVRDVTAILNKMTPSNIEKLILQLDKLEMNNAERIKGLINVMFTKAVEAAIFCSIYADVCKHFQKKQVTVPDENGQPQTYVFRQHLLTRCQKEFEGDYRQEIEYEKRKGEVDIIADEKARREATEQLEEDLIKAKRRKLGNIIFIGELFKLDMLTDTIMYDCVEYLLRDKTDEEALECLCKLLRVIGAKIDAKANEKAQNRKKLEKNYEELLNISNLRPTSARIRFMIQDVLEMKKAGWVARRAEMKPKTIEEIHEEARLKREQEDFDRERDKQQRRDYNRSGGGPPLYGESRGSRGSGSRGSGIRQQSNRTDEDRNDNRVIVDSLRQYQSSEKRNQGQVPLSLAPQRAWGKGSGVEKKPEDDRANAGRNSGKPPAGLNPPYRTKTGASPGTPGYPTQRQPSRELARENSIRDRENATDSLRRIASAGASNPNNTNSREGSRNVSREQSRNVSPDSIANERTSISTRTSTADNNVNATFDEEKTEARVKSLIEEYTENYSENNIRPVNEAIEDLTNFCTPNVNQQAIIVRELFTKVLEAKPRARKAVGHLLDAALQKEIITTNGFQAGVKLIIEVVPDYAVDIPLIWQYIGEIFGAFIGAPSSNMKLLKPILQSIPEPKTKQVFQDILRYAVEFSSQEQIQKFWQSAGLSLNELIPTDPSLLTEYAWLTDPVESEPAVNITTKDILTPRADPQLVELFKSVNSQESTVDDEQILTYIRENMDPKDKYYIRNIVLSYLEACLISRDSQKKIQEDIAKKQTVVLNKIINHQPEGEIQAVYAIQNFVHKLEHPSKMAKLLFDIFYDEECVSEDVFFQWLNQPDSSELEGHSGVGMSTKDFFEWLEKPESDNEEEKKN